MIHSIAKRIAVFLFKETENFSEEFYIYGFELIISSLLETILLFMVGAVIGKFLETILFVAFFSALRVFTGGYHASTFTRCFGLTMIVFLLALCCCELLRSAFIDALFLIYVFCFTFIMYLIFLLAPVEGKNKTVNNRKSKKIISVFVFTLENILFIILYFLFCIESSLIIIPTYFFVGVLMIMEAIQGGDNDEKIGV